MFFKQLILLLLLLGFAACSSMDQMQMAVARHDYTTACSLAEQNKYNDSHAMSLVGVCYYEGYGGYPKDKERAMRWFKFAARRNDSFAQEMLVREGLEVPSPDLAIAEQQAEQQANMAAQAQQSQAWSNALMQQQLIQQQQQQQLQESQQQRLRLQQLDVGRSTNCTSNVIGGTVFTNCN